MKDPSEKRLDRHFRQQLCEFDSSFKKIACKSDQIIINYWMHIYKKAPKEQKLSRNCLTLLMYGHLNEFGYLQYPFTDMRNCGRDLNKVLNAYKGLPYLKRVNAVHNKILLSSDTSFSLDKPPLIVCNDYVLTDAFKEQSSSDLSTSKRNSSSWKASTYTIMPNLVQRKKYTKELSSLNQSINTKNSSLSYLLPSKKTSTYTILPKSAKQKCCCNERSLSAQSAASKTDSSLSYLLPSRNKSTYTILPKLARNNGSKSFDTRSMLSSVSTFISRTLYTYDSHQCYEMKMLRTKRQTYDDVACNTTIPSSIRDTTNDTNIQSSGKLSEVPNTSNKPDYEAFSLENTINTSALYETSTISSSSVSLAVSANVQSCQGYGIYTKKAVLRLRHKRSRGFRLGVYGAVCRLGNLRGLVTSEQSKFIDLLDVNQSWYYYRSVLQRNYASLQLMQKLLMRSILNEKWRLLIIHLRIQYTKCVQKACSEGDEYQLTARQLMWMLDGLDSEYLRLVKALYFKFTKLYK